MCEPGIDFVPLTEAAQLLDTTEVRVVTMLENNELQGKMVANAWQVDRTSITPGDRPKSADIASPGGCGICGSGCGGGC